MTVLIPGLDDQDQRVKISSLDDSQQGILDSFKSKVRERNIYDSTDSIINERTISISVNGEHCRATQQDPRLERRDAVVCVEFPRARNQSIGEELSAHPRLRPRLHSHAVRSYRRRHFHNGLQISTVRATSIPSRSQLLRRQARLRVNCSALIGIFQYLLIYFHVNDQDDSKAFSISCASQKICIFRSQQGNIFEYMESFPLHP